MGRWGVLFLAALMASSACAGRSDEEQVRAVTREWLSAFVDGDWERVCRLSTERFRSGLATAAAPRASCEEGMANAFRLPEPTRRQLRENWEFRASSLTVDGDQATVRLEETPLPEGNQEITLRREQSEWRVGG